MNKNVYGWVLLLLLLCAVPLFLDQQGYPLRVFTIILLSIAMAQSWNIIGGLTNQISLGHAAFFGLGAYTSTILQIDFGVNPWVGLLIAGLFGGILGALLSLPTMRLKSHYFALATLAFGEVMRIIANTWTSLTGGPVGTFIPMTDSGWISMQFKSGIPYYYIMLAAACLATLLFILISRSKMGYRLRAIKADASAAEVIGVDTVKLKIIIATISAAVMGVCGTLYAQFNLFFDPDSAFALVGVSISVALICIVGGAGTAIGPIIGAFCILPLEEVASNLFSGQSAGVSQLAYGLLLIFVIIAEPRGLYALSDQLKKLTGAKK